MALDAWLPIGFKLPDGAKFASRAVRGPDWQILETKGGGRRSSCMRTLAQRLAGCGAD
jgi:cell division protease FtsH